MTEIKDKLITAENLKNAYDDNKRSISELKGEIGEYNNALLLLKQYIVSDNWANGYYYNKLKDKKK